MVSTRTSLMLLFIVPVFVPGLISANIPTQKPTTPKPVPCSPREGSCTEEGAYCESTDIQCRDGYKGAIGECSREDAHGRIPHCQCCKPEIIMRWTIYHTPALPTPSLPKPAICESKNKCEKKKGTCQSKSTECDGKIIKGGCRGGSDCVCCAASVTHPPKCKTKDRCTKKGGKCQSKNTKCTGRTIRRGCKGGKSCKCCIDQCELPYVKVDGQCLLFITERNSWDESVEKCKEYRDTDIAVLTDIKEVAQYMRQQNLKVTWWHVGAHNREDHTKHTWINGGDDVTGPWETLNSKEPSLSDGNQCVHINPGGVLADTSCNMPLPVICSKKK